MDNPYETTSEGGDFVGNSDKLSANAAAQHYLFSSKGWVRFLSVLGFISFAFTLIGVLGTLAIIGKIGGFGVVSFLMMAIASFITFLLSMRLSKFASSIGRMQLTQNPAELEIAMIEQMKFWKLLGILTLIWVILSVIGLISAI